MLYVFPMFMIPISLARGCIIFKRGSIDDKQVGARCTPGKLTAASWTTWAAALKAGHCSQQLSMCGECRCVERNGHTVGVLLWLITFTVAGCRDSTLG